MKRLALSQQKSYKVRVPRVARAKAWLECRLLKHEELFGYDLIFGRVLLAGAESLNMWSLRPVGRVFGGFCKIIEINQEL